MSGRGMLSGDLISKIRPRINNLRDLSHRVEVMRNIQPWQMPWECKKASASKASLASFQTIAAGYTLSSGPPYSAAYWKSGPIISRIQHEYRPLGDSCQNVSMGMRTNFSASGIPCSNVSTSSSFFVSSRVEVANPWIRSSTHFPDLRRKLGWMLTTTT